MRITVPVTTAVLEALHVVPPDEGEANAYMRDVVGNKTDDGNPVAGTKKSLVTYVKGVLGLQVVPTVDVAANAYMRDVVGNKTDASQTTLTATTSLISYVKGVLSRFLVSTADSELNVTISTTVGNKTDALVEVVGTTKTLMAYVKGVIQELAQRSVAKMVRVTTTSSSLADVVNITDRGVLTGISQVSQGADYGRVKLTIDGDVIYGPTEFAHNALSMSLSYQHRFDTSLLVEHSNGGGSVTVATIVAYTTD